MSPEEINIEIARHLGQYPMFLLKKRGMYYRENAAGYTSCLCEAWVVDEATAKKHVYPHDEPVTAHPAPVKNYCGDLNAMNEAELSLGRDGRQSYVNLLWPQGYSVMDAIAAPPLKRAECFLKAIKKEATPDA